MHEHGSQALWRVAVAHTAIGMAILFLTLHPLRDALDVHALALTQTASALQAMNGIGLLAINQRSHGQVATWLIAVGTFCFAAMIYTIAFTGRHPLDLLVPAGGLLMIAGWIKLGFERA